MKKIYTLAAMLGMAAIAHAQNPEIKSELPTILPPSPTAAALMKFEEVPVDNYTGTPDINIPVFSTPTRSKDINLDISLKYHPASAAASETASDAGLGWSLFVGGTVSRTVRGIPDEYVSAGTKTGIYRNDPADYPNPYYELAAHVDSPGTNPNQWNEFLWNAQVKGIYDTEHDLWQFNFMGYTGRFIMKKNALGQLEVMVQDLSNNLKIVNHYNTTNFTPTGFTIYDDKGYKYVFDVAETTASSETSFTRSFTGSGGGGNPSPTISYISSFQLSGVYDNNQKLLLGYTYNPSSEPMREVSVIKNTTWVTSASPSVNSILDSFLSAGGGVDMQGQDAKLEPFENTSITTLTVNSKKVKRINVDGIARIYMDYESGRQDQSLISSAYRIKSVTTKTWTDSISIKKTELFHSYKETEYNNKRMFLNRVEQSNFADTEKLAYTLYYDEPDYLSGTLIRDPWGYFTLQPNGMAGYGYREASPNYCTADILQKMELPTGGAILFDFESNEYSSIGNTPVTNFDENPLNWNPQTTGKSFTSSGAAAIDFFTISEAQQVIFDVTVTPISGWSFILYNSSNTAVANFVYAPVDGEAPPTQFSASLPAGSYKVRFSGHVLPLPNPFTASITANYKSRSGANKQYLFGGGVRIGRISFFDAGNVPQDYYEVPSAFIPAKEKKYDYHVFGQAAKSSGSLAFAKPVYDYSRQRALHAEFNCGGGGTCNEYDLDILYTYHTDFNNLQALRTKGSDVGYQNTTVSETGNGRTQYTYVSPIDVPEALSHYTLNYPFFPSENLDHKRGQLIKEEVFDNASKILSRTEYTYETIDEAHGNTLIGMRIYESAPCPGVYKFAYYSAYTAALASCASNPNGYNCQYLCGAAMSFAYYEPIYEAFGWTRLIEKTTKQFFGTTSTEVGTSESYTYNASNKKIASQTTTLRTGEALKTDFFYHTGNSSYSQNRISEIERIDSYRNSELLSTSKVIYSNAYAGNASWLPQTVQTSKGTNGLEIRIRYTSYDEYEHPLEAQQENGMKVSYVWGYNKSQPIAKIENMAYASLPAGLVTAVQNASNAIPYDNTAEASLLSALEDLRISVTASGGQMTGYTYKPLVGVSTVIDLKGDRNYYDYDGFDRLTSVKDRNGKLLSENKYHYRTSFTDQNSIETIAYKIETSSSLSSPTAAQAMQSITYFDGLGRPIQQRAHRQSGSGKDLVTPIVYDAIGRHNREYLPYPSATATLAYDGNAETAASQYYGNTPAPPIPGFETTANPFSEKLFEASPLNRVLKLAAPGNAWAMGQGHEIKTDYLANSSDEVKIITAYATWSGTVKLYNPAVLVTGNYYAAGELYKTVTKDENWVSGSTHPNDHTVEEFKDKEGHVILKRTYDQGVKHDTYYVYDQFGNLACVMPPKADGTAGAFNINNLCYVYRYDRRNRLVEKKLPGKQWEFIVYDNLDRVVAAGPALAPFSDITTPNNIGWLITKYDAYGRVAYTGWMASSTVTSVGRKNLQDARDLQTTGLSEAKSASNTTINGVAVRYTNTAWPTSGYHVLSASYYDDYAFPGGPVTFADVEGEPVYYHLSVKPIGLPTGSWTRALQGSTVYAGETSYLLYDYKGRTIQSKATNYLGGHTTVDSKLDFSGKPEYTVTRHKKTAAGDELYIKDLFTYTEQDRPETHLHQIGENGDPELLSKSEYDELGRLISKRVGGYDITAATYHQKVDYAYTVRGWLKDINSLEEDIDSPEDLFAFRIGYNTLENNPTGTLTALYNGNISETFWKSKNDNHIRSYSYGYDALNRLKDAYYHKNNHPSFSYDEQAEYDKNGNITKMTRNGDLDDYTFSIQIDDLDYAYDTGNRLLSVKDNSIHPAGFNDGANLSTEYTYDDWGNMLTDSNKGVSITYNHMDLPTQILFANGNKINYLYDTEGTKLRKDVDDGSTVTVTDYLSGFQYVSNGKSSGLDFFPTTEGYVRIASFHGAQTYRYIYNYTDHLGNVRMSYTQDPMTDNLTIMEENNYYPFGMKHDKYNSNTYAYQEISTGTGYYTGLAVIPPGGRSSYQYKYNGKEYQDELGLNFYNYGARNYDPAIGRWMNMDPLAEKSRRFSPYAYALNNPVFFIDPDGMTAEENKNMPKIEVKADYMVDIGYGRMRPSSQVSSAIESSGDMGESTKSKDNDCPSCKTKADWAAYYQQGENTAAMLGESPIYGGTRLTIGYDEDGHTLFYLDGKLMDLRRYSNRAEALGSLLSDAALIEAPSKLFKAIRGIFKSGTAKEVTKLGTYELELTHSLTKSKSAFAKLKADIKLNGMKEPIKYVIHNGKRFVVDGHHRLRAAKELGIQSVPVKQVQLPYAGYKSADDLIYTRY
ncbi:RHS repeat-associated protein [Flavobacterium gossypii]|uniref:RHS repeat-associated protein n=1 Tax=Flavobacterium gossypii TaxID=1646119 RepID=A0ABR6DQS9_9FLAO|nr:DUF6443 domain-containing protein [Flavobacterium gossypii]MBA9073220.1 RHS repeat-associated protein [Flavobacterium gossypii]